MGNAVAYLTGNHILNVAIISFMTAQLLKVIIVLITKRKFDFTRITGSGGMPSGHSAAVCSLATAVGRTVGTDSPTFAVACLFAIIVMYDASNVRRAAGEQAKILNYMMDHWTETTPEIFGRELKELLGHTPIQVLCGALLGIALGFLL